MLLLFLDNLYMKVARISALRTGRLYSAPLPRGQHWWTLLALFITSVILSPKDATLTEVFHGFPQYLQANYEE
jgi:hypothetical protein